FVSRRRCFGGHAETGLSRSDAANAWSGNAGSGSLGIVAARDCQSWLRRKEDRHSADRNSAGRISISRTHFSGKRRMAIHASRSFDREKRLTRHAPGLRQFSQTTPGRETDDRRRRPLAERSEKACPR